MNKLAISRIIREQREKFCEPFVYLDIGARGASLGIWESLGSDLYYIGFEPDKSECEHLNLLYKFKPDHPIHKYWPIALAGENKKLPFIVTIDQNCSSLLQPNSETAKLIGLEKILEESHRIEIEAMTLGSWIELNAEKLPNFIKLDIQGAELAVLSNAGRALDNCVGLQVEISFIEIYKKQPLFYEIDKKIQELGFVLIDLRKKYARCGKSQVSTRGILAWGDAVYLRDPVKWLNFDNQDNHHKFMININSFFITCEAYGVPDYAITKINEIIHNEKTPENIKADLILLIAGWEEEINPNNKKVNVLIQLFKKLISVFYKSKKVNNLFESQYHGRTRSEEYLFPSEYK
jgi:FkbM family methyltransferase